MMGSGCRGGLSGEVRAEQRGGGRHESRAGPETPGLGCRKKGQGRSNLDESAGQVCSGRGEQGREAEC